MTSKKNSNLRQVPWELLTLTGESNSGDLHVSSVEELLKLLPDTPKTILHVVDKVGDELSLYKDLYPGCRVVVLELASALTCMQGREHSSVDIAIQEALNHGLQQEQIAAPQLIDAVVLADVISKMQNPWLFLKALHPWLTQDAVLLLSQPNLRNLSVLSMLAKGDWPYADQGLLDIRNIRYFTKRELHRLLEQTGYEVLSWARSVDKMASECIFGSDNFLATMAPISLHGLSAADADELSTTNYFVLLQPKHGLAKQKLLDGQSIIKESHSSPEISSVDVVREKIEQDLVYRRWVLDRAIQPKDRIWYEEALSRLETRPVFHLVTLLLPGRESALGQTLGTLDVQLYEEWSLTVIAFSPQPEGLQLPAKVSWREVSEDEDSLDVMNSELSNASGWVGMLEVGDRIAQEALAKLVLRAEMHSDWQVIYTDEDLLDEHLRRTSPLFKPDFNLDLLRSWFYIGGFTVIKQSLFTRLGGFHQDAEGLEEYDLLLRAWELGGGGVFGHVADILYHRDKMGGHAAQSPEELWDLGALIVQRHLTRCGFDGASVSRGHLLGRHSIELTLKQEVLVSIVIPTKDQATLLKACVDSIRAVSSYKNFEIILVDNNTSEPDALALLDRLKKEHNVRVLSYPYPFNFSAQVNLGVDVALGDYIVLLNNDTKIITADWLEQLISQAQRDDVGCVGVKLLYPDRTIQHVGVNLGINHQPAEHPCISQIDDLEGREGRLGLVQNFSAVTAACMMVRRDVYLSQKGFDAENFAVSFNDVDFCLRLGASGRLIVWIPNVVLIHMGSVSQQASNEDIESKHKRFMSEQDRMFAKWPKQIAFDPAYNRNLTLATRNCSMEGDPFLTLDPEWRPRPRIIVMPGDHWGCGEYRIKAPMRCLNNAGLIQGVATERFYGPSELEKISPDSVVFQRQLMDHQIESIKRYKKQSSAFRVFELDDLVTDVPEKVIEVKSILLKEASGRLYKAVSFCDRFVVSTPELANAYQDICSDIRVVPNYIERQKWGYFSPHRLQTERPRVGWAGGSSHTGDLEMIAEVVRILHKEVDWVFFGMCPEAFRPYVHEYHHAVPIDAYPAKLASLNLDLALAPLENFSFNEAKSHLRLLEYGILGYPVVCTDIAPYRGEFPVVRVSNKVDEWVDAIRFAVKDRAQLALDGDRLRDHINRNWILEDNLSEWTSVWLP